MQCAIFKSTPAEMDPWMPVTANTVQDFGLLCCSTASDQGSYRNQVVLMMLLPKMIVA